MLFNSWEYWLFFLIVLPLFYSSPLRIGRYVLLAASYFFYMWWNPKFILLILASTLIDYFCGRALPRLRRYRRLVLVVSLASNLGLLGFFKYYNFFASSLSAMFGLSPDSLFLQIILPVGISFYTFQSMSYTIDIYRGELQPVDSFTDFALFVAFFPQLVAGPIVRAREFLPQLKDWHGPSARDVQEGILLLLLGLIKKMVLADHFALISDAYFGNVGASPGAWAAWTGTLAFAMQIFFDFSGYTDIARGSALLMGFRFPSNFERPYLASSITDFWRRWHISLSTWLRDYLYIPLGGNRNGRWNTYRNLMITMLLGGLWHGASWNFVIWGGYHGGLLAAHRIVGRRTRSRPPGWPTLALRPLTVLLNFGLVLIGWVFFRARTFDDSWWTLQNLFSLHGSGAGLMGWGLWAALLGSMALAVLEERWGVFQRLVDAPATIRILCYGGAFAVLELFSVTDLQIPFVYFQF
ncbi:MAG: MBOAT family O-acyltransferase [Acidobacteriota bacterium]